MMIHTAGWSGMVTLFVFLFVVMPSLRWGVWGGRWGRGSIRGPRWSGADWDNRAGRTTSREIDELRGELDARLGEVDQLHSRVTELENRLDFAERLLAQHRDPVLTPGNPQRQAGSP